MTELTHIQSAALPSAPARLDLVPIAIFAVFAAAPFLAPATGAEGYVLSLLTRQAAAKAMGQAARRLVVDRMSWTAALASLPAILGRGVPEQRDAA